MRHQSLRRRIGDLLFVLILLFIAPFPVRAFASDLKFIETCRLSLEYCVSLRPDLGYKMLSKHDLKNVSDELDGGALLSGAYAPNSNIYIVEVLVSPASKVRGMCRISVMRYFLRELSMKGSLRTFAKESFVAPYEDRGCELLDYPKAYVVERANEVGDIFNEIYNSLYGFERDGKIEAVEKFSYTDAGFFRRFRRSPFMGITHLAAVNDVESEDEHFIIGYSYEDSIVIHIYLRDGLIVNAEVSRRIQ
jgi:hypothetical protein